VQLLQQLNCPEYDTIVFCNQRVCYCVLHATCCRMRLLSCAGWQGSVCRPEQPHSQPAAQVELICVVLTGCFCATEGLKACLIADVMLLSSVCSNVCCMQRAAAFVVLQGGKAVSAGLSSPTPSQLPTQAARATQSGIPRQVVFLPTCVNR
jgi:hypothetical protein